MHLPEEFSRRMRAQLGDEYDAFCASYEEEGCVGLRLNTRRRSAETFRATTPFRLTPVPWTDNGFYYWKEEPVTRHPHYYAGLYYIQEPSAMLPASVLPVEAGDVVLDLCAAPGGKATELSSRLRGEGLLIANDVSASRAKALLRNLTLWGAENCCVTAETPQRLLEAFGCYFDKILVDAPCSGEGMFRRDAGLIEAWKERGPQQYAVLQQEILSCAVQMLRPGGYLLYSTCTFSEEEDEAVVERILRRYPELELSAIPMQEGFVPGRAPCEKSVRLFPHRVKGEGHYAALLHKRAESGDAAEQRTEMTTPATGQRTVPCETAMPVTGQKAVRCAEAMSAAEQRTERCKTALSVTERRTETAMPAEVAEFLRLVPGRLWEGRGYAQIGEQCLLLPPYDLPGGLRYLRTGILAGTRKRGRFEPSQALAMLLDADSYPQVLDLPAQDARVTRYLKGETIDAEVREAAGTNGWTLVCVDGLALGWGKYADGRLKNKYYPGWRLQG